MSENQESQKEGILEKIKEKIPPLGQTILGEVEAIGGILTADPTTHAEGELNLEVASIREDLQQRRSEEAAAQNTNDESMNRTLITTGYSLPGRMQGLQPTLIRQFFERAPVGSINFGLGEPDLPTPDFMRQEAARIAVNEQNGYTSHPGIPELRELVASQYPHLGIDKNNVVITCGSQEAMTAAMLAIVDSGDEVLIPDPGFPAYDACVRLAGGKPVYYRLPKENGFEFSIDEFTSKLSPRTKAAVLISPSNPTGKILKVRDLEQISSALDKSGVYLISDEIYSDLYFGEKPQSASRFYARTVIVSGLSKSLSMTGWRLGWAASSDKDVMRSIQVLHGYLTVCTSTITQKASMKAWTDEAEAFKQMARDVYKKRGEILINLFKDKLGLEATKPEGAFYTMLDVRPFGDDMEIAEKCLAAGVITVPGRAFGEEAKGYLRISLCNTEEKMKEGVERMVKALRQ
ncbi:MAG TPA: pyridoxal phosphate-dependent aminotransferase [Pyrinomonadaceae bacterium]|nr:pyridoxal phosphate-dependent aminotransferase [Pyrinomonadaceae bacterium]